MLPVEEVIQMYELKERDATFLAAQLFHLGPSVIDAISLSAFVHDGQFRKETRAGVSYKDPYITHPLRNAVRAVRFLQGNVPDHFTLFIVNASLLHDTVEDAPERIVRFYEISPGSDVRESALTTIRDHFGSDVSDPVRRVTMPPAPSGQSSSDRAADYLEHLRTEVVSDEKAWLVKAMDLIDNAGSIKHMPAGERREKLGHKYIKPLHLLIDYNEIVESVSARSAITERLKQIEQELQADTG